MRCGVILNSPRPHASIGFANCDRCADGFSSNLFTRSVSRPRSKSGHAVIVSKETLRDNSEITEIIQIWNTHLHRNILFFHIVIFSLVLQSSAGPITLSIHRSSSGRFAREKVRVTVFVAREDEGTTSVIVVTANKIVRWKFERLCLSENPLFHATPVLDRRVWIRATVKTYPGHWSEFLFRSTECTRRDRRPPHSRAYDGTRSVRVWNVSVSVVMADVSAPMRVWFTCSNYAKKITLKPINEFRKRRVHARRKFDSDGRKATKPGAFPVKGVPLQTR